MAWYDDVKGFQIEPGDKVRVLITLYQDEDPDRKGTIGKATPCPYEDIPIRVTFEDGLEQWYYGEELEVISP